MAKPRSTARREILKGKCYALHVDGVSVQDIAARLDINRHTAGEYIREAFTQRKAQLDVELSHMVAVQHDRYHQIARRALKIADEAKMPGDTGRLDTAIRAYERMDKVLGVEAPARHDAGIETFLNRMEAAVIGKTTISRRRET
ncbi:MAG: hypothetical protein GIW99_04945 [Candidatus Eremiobacteraeota bacterium]|nr:hypothetical protein [Candidatus Eremiobacteraeota bacterium]MBC5827012.1 hypothetical protein [Candidatus Eremiobacteraeota bacterium]